MAQAFGFALQNFTGGRTGVERMTFALRALARGSWWVWAEPRQITGNLRDLKIKWFSTLGRDDDNDDDGYLTTIVAYLFTAILENLKRVWIESMGGRFLFALFREIYNEFIKIWQMTIWMIYLLYLYTVFYITFEERFNWRSANILSRIT